MSAISCSGFVQHCFLIQTTFAFHFFLNFRTLLSGRPNRPHRGTCPSVPCGSYLENKRASKDQNWTFLRAGLTGVLIFNSESQRFSHRGVADVNNLTKTGVPYIVSAILISLVNSNWMSPLLTEKGQTSRNTKTWGSNESRNVSVTRPLYVNASCCCTIQYNTIQ